MATTGETMTGNGNDRQRIGMSPLGAAERLELLRLAERAAGAAGAAIVEVYSGGFDVRQKRDLTPVTAADLAAERVILAMLAEECPEIPVISEEQAEAEGLPSEAPFRFWVVDPLDATKEFVARSGEFSVNIGLIEAGRPILGVVHCPVLDDSFSASGPGTASRRRGGIERPIEARKPPPGGLVVVHSRSHESSARLAELLQRYTVAARRSAGSAWKLGLVAAGEADLYPRLGPTMEWDTAAGQAILEAAGGSIEAMEGGPLAYGKAGFLNGGFIARGLA